MKECRDEWLERAMAQWEVPLLRTCYLLLRDVKLAEDAVQETFVKAWQNYAKYRGEAGEKTWLMRIAVNACRDMQRSRWSRHVDSRVSMDDLPEAAAPLEAGDDTLTRAVLALPDALRCVVVLRFYQELPVQDIARILHVSRRTVQYRLNRAESMLRDDLKEWYYA